MCEIKWYEPRSGANKKRPDVHLSTGKKNPGFNLTFSESVLRKVAPSGKIAIGIMGSRMFFKDNGPYSLSASGSKTEKKYLSINLNTHLGRDGIDWINKYGTDFSLLVDEKTGLYCIDANGNTTKEDN